ncbi:hypothetical protein HOY80DRAFT_989743 [Tuber brumale]|nr:hypothetical protein HOY80DRAFT_989743 [Tuber brumale]
MSSADRSAWRNTFIYASNDRDTVLGGLWATPGITNRNLYAMLEIFCLFRDTFELHDKDGQLVEKDEAQLQPGNYYIVTQGTIILTNEVPLLRAISLQSGTRVAAFRDENGILLKSDMHHFFDSYHLTINPDDNYKVVSFAEESLQFNLPHQLDQTFLNNPLRPVDQLLRWHFRQAVLTNMKGAGEPCFENDFPPGTDMMGEIMSGPKAGERMEFELFSRFNAAEGSHVVKST